MFLRHATTVTRDLSACSRHPPRIFSLSSPFEAAERRTQQMYDERMVAPMREELTKLGVQEARTAAEVDQVLGEKKGTVFVVVNSVCGCAAGMARPAVAMALENENKPDRTITV